MNSRRSKLLTYEGVKIGHGEGTLARCGAIVHTSCPSQRMLPSPSRTLSNLQSCAPLQLLRRTAPATLACQPEIALAHLSWVYYDQKTPRLQICTSRQSRRYLNLWRVVHRCKTVCV